MLPWTEKYRPNNLDDVVLDNDTRQIFNNIIDTNIFPNMLLYGPPGTGKTTTALCLLKKYKFPSENIHLNASDERGIDIIRTQLYSFIHTKGLFQSVIKFIILDEVDSMTKQAQTSLLSLMVHSNVRFILICNYLSKLISPLRDYLLLIPFYNTSNDTSYINNIMNCEHLELNQDVLNDINFNYYPDLRSVVNCLQTYQSYSYPLICKKIILLNCVNYNAKVKKYIKTVCFKDYLIKLFINMINYNIDSTLINMMKNLILIKQDIDYFENYFIKYYNSIN